MIEFRVRTYPPEFVILQFTVNGIWYDSRWYNQEEYSEFLKSMRKEMENLERFNQEG